MACPYPVGAHDMRPYPPSLSRTAGEGWGEGHPVEVLCVCSLTLAFSYREREITQLSNS